MNTKEQKPKTATQEFTKKPRNPFLAICLPILFSFSERDYSNNYGLSIIKFPIDNTSIQSAPNERRQSLGEFTIGSS